MQIWGVLSVPSATLLCEKAHQGRRKGAVTQSGCLLLDIKGNSPPNPKQSRTMSWVLDLGGHLGDWAPMVTILGLLSALRIGLGLLKNNHSWPSRVSKPPGSMVRGATAGWGNQTHGSWIYNEEMGW